MTCTDPLKVMPARSYHPAMSMTTSSLVRRLAAGLFAVAVGAAPSAAQGSVTYRVGGGYSHVAVDTPSTDGGRYHGWYASGSRRLTDWTAIAIDFGGDYSTDPYATTSGIQRQLYAVMGGLQLSANHQAAVSPLARGMVGVMHERARFEGDTDSINRAFVELGLGGRVKLVGDAALEVSGNWRRLFWHGNRNDFRLLAGVCLNLASR